MPTVIDAFLHSESGATAIEYGLIAALISIAAIGAFDQLGQSLRSVFDTISSSINEAIGL